MKNKLPFELRITLIYITVGAIWILFSDRLLYFFTKNPQQLNVISIYKGWFYVLITGLLLYMLIKKEIQKRNQLYNELLTANKKALESERLKSAFLSNLSHYIRTPMNSILGFADLIQSRNLDEIKRNRFLDLINEKSHHLLQTINNIVEISKIQEGQVEIKKSNFSINNMFDRLLLTYEQDLAKRESTSTLSKNIVLTTEEDQLFSDYDKIYHILANLLTNAINFTENGKIELGVKTNANLYTFYVKDSGPGISEDKQKNLFANLLQVHTDIRYTSEGSGLGLFLSENLAKLLGGKLWLEYSNEKGSLFCFSIQSEK